MTIGEGLLGDALVRKMVEKPAIVSKAEGNGIAIGPTGPTGGVDARGHGTALTIGKAAVVNGTMSITSGMKVGESHYVGRQS